MMHYRVLSHVKSAALAGLLAIAVAGAAHAQKKYDPGATDTEIKIGNIMPYSGPLSAYATIGKTEAAYFKKINEEGGINGRKLNFISYDDGYNPAKTVDRPASWSRTTRCYWSSIRWERRAIPRSRNT
jgi:branched-chain amino acid transport system substrate-binding protein